MPLRNHLLDRLIQYSARKLAENPAFQKLSLAFHEKMNEIRQTAVSEIVKPDPSQISIRRVINQIIESSKDFINKK